MSPTTAGRLAAIYECPDCETRYVNERRCPDCNLFCRRVGTGGTCPHGDEPLTLTDLTDLTEEEVIMPIT